MSRNRNSELFTFKTSSIENRYTIPKISSEKTLTCWNCSFILKSDDSQPIILCPNCNKYNRVPHGKIININDNSDNDNDNNDANMHDNYIINNRYNDNFTGKILVCPFCYTKNLFERDADELICYKCSRKIKSENNNEIHDILTERESLDKKIIGWKLVPNPQYINHPLTPIPQNSQNSNTEYLLKKILKSIKKQNNARDMTPLPTPMYNPYIPFPVFDFYSNRRSINYRSEYDEDKNRTREIRYIPIRSESEKEKKEGYKITIRKRNRKKNGLAKSTVFEKVFYINK